MSVEPCKNCGESLAEYLRITKLHSGSYGPDIWMASCWNCGYARGFETEYLAENGDITQAAFEAMDKPKFEASTTE